MYLIYKQLMEHYKAIHQFYTDACGCDGKQLDNVLRHFVRLHRDDTTFGAEGSLDGLDITKRRNHGIVWIMDQYNFYVEQLMELKNQLRESIGEIRRLKKLLKENNIKY